MQRPGRGRTKTIHDPHYGAILALLREARKEAGLSQGDVAAKIGYSRTVISKWECGELRMDLLQVRRYCAAIGLPFIAFVERVEAALATPTHDGHSTSSRPERKSEG